MIHLPSLLAFLRTVCHPFQAADRVIEAHVAAALDDDLTALARATGVYVDDHGYRIDAAVADFAAEIAAIADDELAELVEGRWTE